MAWGKSGRPTWKYCHGYGRPPHRKLYDKDFPRHYRTLKSGKRVFYAGPLCKDCRPAYERDLRRMNTILKGRGGRPQDVPWKKYRRKQDETWIRGLNARGTRLPADPFFKWFDRWMKRHNFSLEEVCRGAGVTSRTVRRWRRQGYLQLHSAEKFFLYARMPQMSQVLYPPERYFVNVQN